jgi:hypothetical protein
VEQDLTKDQTLDEINQNLVLKWMTYKEVKRAFAKIHPIKKYDLWMQYEAIILAKLKEFLDS